jgi:hypothetical protein
MEYLSLQKDQYIMIIFQCNCGTFFHFEHLLVSTLENMAACKMRYGSATVSVFTEVKVCFAYI